MISQKTKELAKKNKIPLTYQRGGKRYKKTEKMLLRNINRKGGEKNPEIIGCFKNKIF